MARTLLYGADAQPVVTDQSDTDHLLVLAFAYATGLAWARCRNQGQVEQVMNDIRYTVMNGVLQSAGCRALIEKEYDVQIFQRDGEWVIRSRTPLPQPPGPPRGGANVQLTGLRATDE